MSCPAFLWITFHHLPTNYRAPDGALCIVARATRPTDAHQCWRVYEPRGQRTRISAGESTSHAANGRASVLASLRATRPTDAHQCWRVSEPRGQRTRISRLAPRVTRQRTPVAGCPSVPRGQHKTHAAHRRQYWSCSQADPGLLAEPEMSLMENVGLEQPRRRVRRPALITRYG
jgi:hypothetical protein